jgi:UDP-glucose 4-epimerase
MLAKPSLEPGDRVVVAGGRGFVGSHIVRALLAFGCEPHVLGPRMDCDLLADLGSRVQFVECGIEDGDAVREALRRIAPAAVVSCAAFGGGGEGLMRAGERDSDLAFLVNVDGLRRLIAACRETGVAQVVWTSSTVVYGNPANYAEERVDERAPKLPETVYGLTKLLAEEVAQFAVRRDGYPVIGLRLPLILGPGLWYRGAAAVLRDMIAAARPGHTHEVSFHDEPIDLMEVGDVAQAVLATLRHAGPLAPIYNITGFTARPREIAAALSQQVPGYQVKFTPQVPQYLFPLVDDALFRGDTGFAPRIDLRRFIADTLRTRETS